MKALLMQLGFLGLTCLLFLDNPYALNLVRFIMWTLNILCCFCLCAMSNVEFALKMQSDPPAPKIIHVVRLLSVGVMAAYGLFVTAGCWLLVLAAVKIKIDLGKRELETEGVF